MFSLLDFLRLAFLEWEVPSCLGCELALQGCTDVGCTLTLGNCFAKICGVARPLGVAHEVVEACAFECAFECLFFENHECHSLLTLSANGFAFEPSSIVFLYH